MTTQFLFLPLLSLFLLALLPLLLLLLLPMTLLSLFLLFQILLSSPRTFGKGEDFHASSAVVGVEQWCFPR